MYDKKLSEDIDKMTYGRVHLWDKLYCDEKCGKDFAEILNKRFEADIRQDTLLVLIPSNWIQDLI